MRRLVARPLLPILGLALAAAACGGGTAPATTTTSPVVTTSTTTPPPTSTTTTTAPTTTTTETTLPAGPPLAVEGDRNEIVAAVQFLLNCNDFGDLEVDGAFGPATRAAVETAQRNLGRTVNGELDEDTFASLARSCPDGRRLEGEGETAVAGNAAPDDPEVFSIALLEGSILEIEVTRGIGATVAVIGADGVEPAPAADLRWEIDVTQDYVIEVAVVEEALTFSLDVRVTVGERQTGDWILATNGLIYKGTRLTLGTDAQTVIDKVFEYLGHGVRSGYGEFDTGWYAITDPNDMGLRGIYIEGFALLFYGPDPNNPDRPEIWARHRFEGPGFDRNGNARAESYATTAEGITVGDTLADLKDAYGTRVRAGSNDEEFYYRLSDSGGELCFYFDTAEEPTDFAPIVEIASQCRR